MSTRGRPAVPMTTTLTVRVTDVYGQVLKKSGITLSPGVVQTSTLQFTRH